MELHGKNIIGGNSTASASAKMFSAAAAVTGEKLQPQFCEATAAEVDEALLLSEKAFEKYRALPPERVAEFLDRAAEEILKLGDELLKRANLETALPEQRLIGERTRTVNQSGTKCSLVSSAEARGSKQPLTAQFPTASPCRSRICAGC